MSSLSEYSIYQNHAIGAHAIWEFVRHYEEYHEKNESPRIIIVMPVLPIVFNMRATDQIKNRSFKEGSLIKTLVENKDIHSGLQQRMESCYDLTMKSIYISSASGLIKYNSNTTQLIANRLSDPKVKKFVDYQDILMASRRLGAWFGQLNYSEICTYFNIHL